MVIKNIHALGLFGGASLNAVELALITTDGVDVYDYIKTATVPYPENLALEIRAILNHRLIDYNGLENDIEVARLKQKISCFYAEIMADFMADEQVDIIGIDGLTIGCSPQNKCSYQIEDGRVVSHALRRQVITHFHKADIPPNTRFWQTDFRYNLASHTRKPTESRDHFTSSGTIHYGNHHRHAHTRHQD